MKQKINFITTIACIVLPIICICLYCKANLISYVDGEAPYYLWNKEKTGAMQSKGYDVIILGDSIANAAYIPAILSDGTLNLALGGTTPMDGYYILQNWLAHNPSPKVCYISYWDAHFQVADWYWTRVMYLHLHRPQQNIEMMKTVIDYQESSILAENNIMDYISYQLWFPGKYITSMMNAHLNQRYESNVAALQTAEIHEGRYMAKGTFEYQFSDELTYGSFSVRPLFDSYYRKLIELCIKNSISVRLIKLPQANIVYTEDYKKDFWDYYEGLHNDYPQITVDWFPNYDAKYYADPFHVNSHGALRFSTELKSLYPDDFKKGEPSLLQVSAINDSIKEENKVDEVINWTNGRDYTVIICDKIGLFESYYKETTTHELNANHVELLTGIDGTCFANIYCIQGQKTSEQECSFTLQDNCVEAQINGRVVQHLSMDAIDALGVIVIDNYNHDVVCIKNFRYAEGQYILN